MNLPISSLANGSELGLVAAVLVGFGFGFVLERAGFGKATKLAGQFYFTDMTVLKVMFGAIVTAMLGLVLFSGLGLIDLRALSESAASQTWLWPMAVGGFMLGVGFIVAGYCPGTSLVAASSGNLDGLMTVAGVVIGGVLYGEVQPLFAGFETSGAVGHLFLYELLGLPPAAVAALVAAMAIGAFVGADVLEKKFAAKALPEPWNPVPSGKPRRAAFGTFALGAAVGLVVLLLPIRSEAVPTTPARVGTVGAPELARRVFDAPWTLRILDLRADGCAEQRIPGAECVPAETLGDLGLAWAPAARDLLLLDEQGLAEAPEAARAYQGRVLLLEGGWAAWKAYALDTPVPPAADAPPEAREAYRLQAGVNKALTGRAPPPPPAPVKGFVPPPKKAGGGCGG